MSNNLVSIVNSILIISTTAILIGGSTLAFFSDTEGSASYTASSARFDLKVSNSETGEGSDGLSNVWVMSDAQPGITTIEGTTWFKNAGAIAADHMEIAVTNKVIDPIGPESDSEEGTTDMAKVVQITKMDYSAPSLAVDCLALLSDSNGNGFIDLDDLEKQGIDNLKPPSTSNFLSAYLNMSLKFHESADNDYQGDSLQSEFIFTLNQDASQ